MTQSAVDDDKHIKTRAAGLQGLHLCFWQPCLEAIQPCAADPALVLPVGGVVVD